MKLRVQGYDGFWGIVMYWEYLSFDFVELVLECIWFIFLY